MYLLFWLFSCLLIPAPQAQALEVIDLWGEDATVLIDCQNGLPSSGYQVEVADSYDNRTPKYDAYLGQAFDCEYSLAGHILNISPISSDSQFTIMVRNKLSVGAIRANFYYKGKLRAFAFWLVPGQRAVFAPKCNSVK